MRITALGLFLVFFAFGDMAWGERLALYSAVTPFELVDHTGTRWRACNDKLVKVLHTDSSEFANPEQCAEFGLSVLGAQWVEGGIQIGNHGVRSSSLKPMLVPVMQSAAFGGDSNDPRAVWRLARHYDGQVSLVSFDNKYLFVNRNGRLRLQAMNKVSKAAKFRMTSASWDGKSTDRPIFDCSPERLKEIRSRYSQVAGNKNLKTKQVSQNAEHEYYDSTTHRFYKGFLAEEHIESGHSGGEWSRYTYFWKGQDAYFEYDVGLSHAEGVKTEIRRYSGRGAPSGSLCRCLVREIDEDAGGPPGPQFQVACDSAAVKRRTARTWELEEAPAKSAEVAPVAEPVPAIEAVYSTDASFAVLRADGSVVTWGDPKYGGTSPAFCRSASDVASKIESSVTAIYTTDHAFAALKSDGSVVTWGNRYYGGTGRFDGGFIDMSPVRSQLSSGVTAMYSTSKAFAAVRSDGSVVAWGDPDYGGYNSYERRNTRGLASKLSSDVTAMYATENAFAAVKSDGSVVSWGHVGYDGLGGFRGSTVGTDAVAAALSSGVTAIYANHSAFAAIKSDGSVFTWGNPKHGGDSSKVASELSSGVVTIYSTYGGFASAFAALKSDGSVVTWGGKRGGGDSSKVASELSSGVKTIYSNNTAFAALKSDGSVVTWGSVSQGGSSRRVASYLSSGVTAIYATDYAFAALKSDGSVVTWGDREYGAFDMRQGPLATAPDLSSGVTAIYSTDSAFAALKSDGSVVTWGNPSEGGRLTRKLAAELSGGVTAIYSTSKAFAAVKSDGRIVTWGSANHGGDSRAVASKFRN